MNRTTTFRALLVACSLVWAGTAAAVSELEVNGGANIDNDFTLDSQESDSESGAPLARTAIEIGDALPGVFEYFAAADITVPKLQVLASYDNTGDTTLGNFETPLLFANASLSDTITLTSSSPDPYSVTAEMVVNGVLDVDGSNGRVVAMIKVSPVGQLSNSDSSIYSSNGTITNDILPIDYEFTGDAEFDIESSLFFFMTGIEAFTSISADFSNTAIIKLLITQNGEPFDGVTVTSSSGNFGTNPVPVPPALWLLLSALGSLGWRARQTPRA